MSELKLIIVNDNSCSCPICESLCTFDAQFGNGIKILNVCSHFVDHIIGFKPTIFAVFEK